MLKKVSKSLIMLILIATVSVGIFSVTVNAEDRPIEQITLSPVKGYEKLDPGEKFKGSFNITNTGTETVDLHVYVKPFGVDKGCTENYEIDSEWTQMTGWTNLEQSNYHDVKPEQTVVVNFSIEVPKNAPDGGQYVIIFVELGKFDKISGAAIGVTKRLGYKFHADLGGKKHQSGKVESLEQLSWYWEPPINSISQVRNNGNIYFTSTHKYSVKSLTGKVLYETSVDQDILPDTCRKMKMEWDKTPAFGLFWVENEIEFLGKEQFSSNKLVIVVPIYVVVIFGVMITLLLWALTLKIKNNKNVKKNTRGSV